MDLCETCKYWEKSLKYETGHSLGLGMCKNIPMFWDATEWSKDGDSRSFRDKYKDVKAFARDGSDYKAFVLTKPNFGCVSHESR